MEIGSGSLFSKKHLRFRSLSLVAYSWKICSSCSFSFSAYTFQNFSWRWLTFDWQLAQQVVSRERRAVVTITHQPKTLENKRSEFQVKKAQATMLLESRMSDRTTTLCTEGLPLLLGASHLSLHLMTGISLNGASIWKPKRSRRGQDSDFSIALILMSLSQEGKSWLIFTLKKSCLILERGCLSLRCYNKRNLDNNSWRDTSSATAVQVQGQMISNQTSTTGLCMKKNRRGLNDQSKV